MAEIPTPPLQIAEFSESGNIYLNEEALGKILLDPDIKGKPVVPISIAGAFRGGKSFLLNFLQRQLMRQDNNVEWLSGENSQEAVVLDDGGFSWRRGTETETKGIWMWKAAKCIKSKSGVDVCVILMDTQGVFDTETTFSEYSSIFALSQLSSSVQIYNVSQRIQEDHLQHLQCLSDYGKLVLANSKTKPFQDLYFLVRDWSNTDEYPFGLEGGNSYLEKILQAALNQDKEFQCLRRSMKNCYELIQCFLLPHPGLEVTESPEFKGELSKIRKAHLEQLKKLVITLLAPENLKIKRIFGRPVTPEKLLELMKEHAAVLQGQNVPKPESIFLANSTVFNSHLKDLAIKEYNTVMEKDFLQIKTYLEESALREKHEESKAVALNMFNEQKLGNEKCWQAASEKLEEEIQERLAQYVAKNKEKFEKTKENNFKLKDLATEKYCTPMDKEFHLIQTYLEDPVLLEKHEESKAVALNMFNEQKMGNKKCWQAASEKLEEEIQERWVQYEAKNK